MKLNFLRCVSSVNPCSLATHLEQDRNKGWSVQKRGSMKNVWSFIFDKANRDVSKGVLSKVLPWLCSLKTQAGTREDVLLQKYITLSFCEGRRDTRVKQRSRKNRKTNWYYKCVFILFIYCLSTLKQTWQNKTIEKWESHWTYKEWVFHIFQNVSDIWIVIYSLVYWKWMVTRAVRQDFWQIITKNTVPNTTLTHVQLQKTLNMNGLNVLYYYSVFFSF